MISGRDERLFRQALVMAELSQVHVRVGVVLARGRRPYVWTHNQSGPVDGEPWPIGHAEIRALNAPFFPVQAKSTMYVARIDRGNKIMPSRPCLSCDRSIKDNGNIKRIVYSDGVMLKEVKI